MHKKLFKDSFVVWCRLNCHALITYLSFVVDAAIEERIVVFSLWNSTDLKQIDISLGAFSLTLILVAMVEVVEKTFIRWACMHWMIDVDTSVICFMCWVIFCCIWSAWWALRVKCFVYQVRHLHVICCICLTWFIGLKSFCVIGRSEHWAVNKASNRYWLFTMLL